MILWDCISEGMEMEHFLEMGNAFLIHFEHVYCCAAAKWKRLYSHDALFDLLWLFFAYLLHKKNTLQRTCTCSKLAIEIPEKAVKYDQS